jgi:hypothetical protein
MDLLQIVKRTKCVKLLKSLYVLKQAPKQWHDKFDNTLTFAGYYE